MVLSSRNMAPEEIYGIYKKRCEIENRFDEAKNCLSADRMHMTDDEHILGHMFVTFLTLSIWSAVADLIDRAGMSGSYTVTDVLDTYAGMKTMTSAADVRQVVPKDVRDLDQKLGLHLYTERKELMTIGLKARHSLPQVRNKKERMPHEIHRSGHT